MVKKSLVTLVAALFTTCSVASGQQVGLSYLGMCHPGWPCESSMRAFDGQDVIRVGWLEKTFSPGCACANRLLADPRPKEIRVHLTNSPCLRNRRCGPYEVFAGETVRSAENKLIRGNRALIFKFKVVARKLAWRLERATGVTCYVSPCLECDLNDQARRILHRITASILPQCVLVDSVYRRRCLKGKVCEVHGPDPRLSAPCIADLDGIPLEQVSVPQYLSDTRQCAVSYLWTGRMNCLTAGASFIDPRKRDCFEPDGYFDWLGTLLHRG